MLEKDARDFLVNQATPEADCQHPDGRSRENPERQRRLRDHHGSADSYESERVDRLHKTTARKVPRPQSGDYPPE